MNLDIETMKKRNTLIDLVIMTFQSLDKASVYIFSVFSVLGAHSLTMNCHCWEFSNMQQLTQYAKFTFGFNLI